MSTPVFPTTKIENLTLSRLIIGTNWFLGWSHKTAAKDKFIREQVTEKIAAEIIEVFMNAGVNCIMGFAHNEKMMKAIHMAQDRVGRKLIIISTPGIDMANTPAADAANQKLLDEEKALGVDICLPHSGCVDTLTDRLTRDIRQMDKILPWIRQRGMIPGLSTHMPEAPVYADERGMDVATYIQIYNCLGFLMQVEIEWIQSVIKNLKKPVMTIKPMAAGRITPYVGLNYVWATLRDIDMVTVGTMTPDEAKECAEISLACLERRQAEVPLQRTRSKKSIDNK